jgi:polysaccharide pyruvyl transferase WcaK-like protein
MTAVRADLTPIRVEVVAATDARQARPIIGVLYPSGWGNLGDEAILQVTFASLRKRWPSASVRAFTLHPARTAANHGVQAEPLSGVNRHLFGAPLGEGPFVVRAARGVARRAERIPGLGSFAQWCAGAVATLVFESISLRRAWAWLRTADIVIASGGGQLDAAWGGSWGQPYALARWAWLARRAGVPFVFQSVGYGSASSWLSRRFIKYAVDNASYCSVRDAGSRAMAEEIGVKRDLVVVPDLAFGLTPAPGRRARRPGYDIGVSPMVFLRPGSWPIEDEQRYRALIGMWAEVVSAIVAKGDRAHLFVSSPGDMHAVNDVCERLDARTRAACTVNCAQTPDALLDFYAGVDAVISSRLHGVLLAIVSAKPVLALSHERKVQAVMTDAGVPNFCLDLTTSTSSNVLEILDTLRSELEPRALQLREYVVTARQALRRQDDLVPRLLKNRP